MGWLQRGPRKNLTSCPGLVDHYKAASALSEQLREKYGVRSSYFSVKWSYSPDDDPAYAGRMWGGGYFITAAIDEDDE